MQIQIPTTNIPVLDECDVLVCGGGPAGITAAVSASLHDMRVILIERWPFVGGMATAGLVRGWHRSDRQKMVIYGLVEEAVKRAFKRNWIKKDPNFPRGHETHWFDPEGMKIVFHDMLDEAGVRTLCYTVASEPIIENGLIKGVLIETKQGRRAVLAKFVVDATGDGDIASKSGVPYKFGRSSDGQVQGMTMMFRLCKINTDQRKEVSDEKLDELFKFMCRLSDEGKLPPFKRSINLVKCDNHTFPNMCPVAGNPLDEEELTRLTIKGRRQVQAYLSFLKEKVPGFKDAEVEQTACSLGIRESRRIMGCKTLNSKMVLTAAKQQDAIGHGVWMIDIHDPKGSGHTTYLDRNKKNMVPEGYSYHIPLGMCLNDTIPNLLVVGRCASCTHNGHASVRVQTHCMVMGQGVGTAASMAVKEDKNIREIDIPKLQNILINDGVYIKDVPVV